jgi:hypothetical protein
MEQHNQHQKCESPAVSLPLLVLDRSEAATVLRISIRKLDYLIECGSITPLRIGGRVLVAWNELLRFVESKSGGETSAPTAEVPPERSRSLSFQPGPLQKAVIDPTAVTFRLDPAPTSDTKSRSSAEAAAPVQPPLFAPQRSLDPKEGSRR